MAEKKQAEAKVEAPEGEAEVKPKKKRKLLIILIVLLLLGGGGGGAAWWFLKGKKPQDPKAAAAEKKEEPEKPPIYIQLEAFLVNLKKADADAFVLQVEMQFKVTDPKVDEAVKLRMPEIRNAILLLLTNKTQEELVTLEGKQKLAADITAQTNQIIRAKEPPKDGLAGVYFKSFVIQQQ